ncbi:MAG: hypothetical protein J6I73_03590 [Treponema sp.]|nr:hypothetical protein [Treponema sp.]
MKKIICIIFTVIAFCSALTAAEQPQRERDERKWSSLTYYNVPLYKILQTKDAYFVIYGKHKVGTGSTVIPKNWARGDPETPRKLKFRSVKGTLQPFMTVVKKDGEFFRVILNVPPSTNTQFWGIGDANKITDVDKDTLEELEL